MSSQRKKMILDIAESMHAVKRRFFACTKKCDELTHSQWAILDVVFEQKSIGVKKLADTLGISSSATTQLVDILVDKKFLFRHEDKKDRRVIMVEISPRSRGKIKKMQEKFLYEMSEIFGGLKDKELKKYAELNKKISNHILKNLNKNN